MICQFECQLYVIVVRCEQFIRDYSAILGNNFCNIREDISVNKKGKLNILCSRYNNRYLSYDAPQPTKWKAS